MLGGALGLAILASLASSRTTDLLATGHSHPDALTGGYHAAFLAGAASAALGAVAAAGWLRPAQTPSPGTAAASRAKPALTSATGNEISAPENRQLKA